MTLQGGQQLAVGRIPQPRCVAPTGSDDAMAVGRELRPPNVVGMSQQLAAGGIPHPRCLVITRGDDALSVGRELRAMNKVGMTLQCGQQLAAGDVHTRAVLS